MAREHASVSLRDLKLASRTARTFSGYGSVFGNVDSHGDVIAKGAFRRTLQEHAAANTMPAMLSQHGGGPFGGEMMPIGVWTSMVEDELGLRVEGRLSDTDRGQEAYILLKDGALSGLSIGYEVRQSTIGTRAGEPKRTLTDIELWEVSLVTFPSNRRARVEAVKGSQGNEISQRDCERALREAGLPRELAKAILAKGWRAVTERPDGEKETLELIEALQAGTNSLSKTIKERT